MPTSFRKLTALRLQQYQDEFLDIWAQSVVARTPTVQHALLSLFFNIENVPALFDGFPFERSERAAQFDVHAAEFNVNRIKVLHGALCVSTQTFSFLTCLCFQLSSVTPARDSRKARTPNPRPPCPSPPSRTCFAPC